MSYRYEREPLSIEEADRLVSAAKTPAPLTGDVGFASLGGGPDGRPFSWGCYQDEAAPGTGAGGYATSLIGLRCTTNRLSGVISICTRS